MQEKTQLPYRREGKYILFGAYPQTIKSDSVTVGEAADSEGYYRGSDGERYARVTATQCEIGFMFSNNTSVESGTVYYFKVEPIKWRILEEKDGAAFLLCDSIIANKAFQSNYNLNGEYYTTANGAPSGTYANNYMYCDIRQWLNDEFYNTAFNSLQQELIRVTEVDNSAASAGDRGNPYACENTNDKVFLLSCKEVTDSAYGFNISDKNKDTERRMQTSDYSLATGASMYNWYGNYYGNGMWRLRSPVCNDSCSVRGVDYDGCVNDDYDVYYSHYGVVPAMIIRI